MDDSQNMRSDAAENLQLVWDYVQKNPCSSQIECADALGLNRNSVGRYWRKIRDGWRPAGWLK